MTPSTNELRRNPDPDGFRRYYEELASLDAPKVEVTPSGERVTLSVNRMPLVTFARMLADETGVSVVVSNRLDDLPVSVEVQDVEVGSVLALVARRLGVELTVSGRVYFIGELRPEDRGVYVRRVRRLDQQGLRSAVETLLSPNGRVASYDDGLVVVGDRVEVLQRVAELLDRVESAGADSWVVQLHLVSSRSSDMSSFGLDLVPSLDAAATLADASNLDGARESSAFFAASLSAMLDAERTREEIELVAAPLFVIVDGGRAELADGDELRIPQFTITDFGTQTVTGFETVQTGLVLEVGLRDLGDQRSRVDVRTEVSSVIGFVADTIPQINTQRFSTSAVLRSGGVYLLGSIERASTSDAVTGPFQGSQAKTDDARTLFIWARVYRVAGPRELPQADDAARVKTLDLPAASSR